MRNQILSKKLKRTEARLLIIDDNQIRYNQICEQLRENGYTVAATLLDDIKNFEKQLNFNWDIIIFGRAYDLKVDQAIALIHSSKQPHLPLLFLEPNDYKQNQYPTYIRKGIYDIINIDHQDKFYYSLVRTLSFSRLQQAQERLMMELSSAHSQAQSLVKGSSKAIAIIQEGIHLQANSEYFELFGFTQETDIIGVPLLDLLQPEDLAKFKNKFKKASQGQFNLGAFEVHTKNQNILASNPLNIEFLAAPEDDAIQLTIEIESDSETSFSKTDTSTQNQNIYQQINHTLTTQPAIKNAIVIFSLATYPNDIYQTDWQTIKSYFSNIKKFLKEQTHVPLFQIDTNVYLGLFQAESSTILESKLIGLNSLIKPQLLNVNHHNYPLNLRISYTSLTENIKDEAHLDQLLSQAFSTHLPQPKTYEPNLDSKLNTRPSHEMTDFKIETPLNTQEFSLEPLQLSITPDTDTTSTIEPLFIEPLSTKKSSLLQALQQALNGSEIHIKYQQLYDKQDEYIYTYEVTSGFIFDNKWNSCSDLTDLSEDHELSIQVDRWILVEACKQLHNFIIQYPEAKLIVNLNKHILIHDKNFPAFISKLITIIGSPIKNPLVLQFNEEDIHVNLAEAQKQIKLLLENGAEISLRKFGNTSYSKSLLEKITINYATLDEKLTNKLEHEQSNEELMTQLTSFKEVQNIDIILRNLNDMNLFANAWNVDARFIQGDYFQKKLDHLIDVQEQ